MKKIGIIGGLSPASTIDYYKIITENYRERYHDYNYPEIFIHSLNFEEIIKREYHSPEVIKNSIESLRKAGADFVIAACNSIHVIYYDIYEELPIPWVSIMEATTQEILNNNFKKVGLVGTRFTMSHPFFIDYLKRKGVEVVLPDSADQEAINRFIYDEIVNEVVSEEAKQLGRKIINNFYQQDQVNGIVLACTELAYLFNELNSPVKAFDTTRIHAMHALELAL